MAFAETTTVPIEKSIAEIVGLVRKAGAARIAQYEDGPSFQISFEIDGRLIRFRVALATEYDGPKKNGNFDPKRWVEQRNRQRARALLLVIKAKLESVESEVETFEQAFLANVVMADGLTVHERISDHVAIEYQTGKVSSPLLMLEGPRNG